MFSRVCVCVSLNTLEKPSSMLRMLLCEELNFFGPGDLPTKLEAAYGHFIKFCREHKIRHSQPPFKIKTVAWHLSQVHTRTKVESC